MAKSCVYTKRMMCASIAALVAGIMAIQAQVLTDSIPNVTVKGGDAGTGLGYDVPAGEPASYGEPEELADQVWNAYKHEKTYLLAEYCIRLR